MDGVFPGQPQSFRHQRRPVSNCSPGREGMAQNGGTRGGTFHGEMDRCRGSQGWTTARSRTPERDHKDQGEDSPKQAGSCWFARPCRLATSGANSYPPGVWFADAMTSFSGVAFLFFCFVFVFYHFVDAAALRSSVLRYARAPIATWFFLFFPLLFIWKCRFLRVFFVTLYAEYVVRAFLPDGVFLPCDHGLDF